jgi:hypothetical protein
VNPVLRNLYNTPLPNPTLKLGRRYKKHVINGAITKH